MTERSNDQVAAQRGEEARQVLANPAFIEAMEAMHAQIVEQWQDCPIRDVEGQRLLLQLKKLARKFEDLLTGLVESGKYAQHRINIDAERDESGARKIVRRVL
jgi:hypothetical protein